MRLSFLGMETLRCFYCKRKVAAEMIAHSYDQHPTEEFALLVKVHDKHFLPKLYNFCPVEHASENRAFIHNLS